MADRSLRSVDRPWLRFRQDQDGGADGHGGDDGDDGESLLPHVLPPERPFAGDDVRTVDLVRRNAADSARRRRRVRRVGWFAVVAVTVAATQPFIEKMLGAW